MGRRKKKKKPQVIDLQEVSTETPKHEEATELKPLLIPKLALKVILNYMDQNKAAFPYCFLTISEYKFLDVNPHHVPITGSPTHILFFCLRLINTNSFTPICAVQTNHRANNQPEKLVLVWKTIIQDLSILGLRVICSVSPSQPMFHIALEQLTRNLALNDDYTGPITYSSYPFTDIIHLYCYNDLMQSFQHTLSERKELHYIAHEGLNNETFHPFCASWDDLVSVMSSMNIKYTSDSDFPPNFSIFSRDFQNRCFSYFKKKLIDSSTAGSTHHMMKLISDFTDITWRNIRMTSTDIQYFYNSTENFRMFLATSHFASSCSECSFDLVEFEKMVINDESDKSSSRTVSVESLPLACESYNLKVDHFDAFINAVCYDKNETLEKTWSFIDTVIKADLDERSIQPTLNSEDEIDYKTYRQLLEQHSSNEDNTLSFRSTFNNLYENIPIKTKKMRITNDWLCTLKGYIMLTERLDERQIKSIYSNLFCLDHVDFYVYLLKRYKNRVTNAHYDRDDYIFFDMNSAFLLMQLGYGVYILTQD